MRGAQIYLVSYDIASPRRWRRVFKILKRVGEHQQLSVFLCRLPPRSMDRLRARLAMLIDPAEDRLMVVALGTAFDAAARIQANAGLEVLRSAPVVIV